MRTRLPSIPRTQLRAIARKGPHVLGLAGLVLVAACQQHSKAWDDQYAQCEAHAIEQLEYAEVQTEQRSTWRERYIGACMQAKGFYDPQSLIGGQTTGER
jgi:hypothetical protein